MTEKQRRGLEFLKRISGKLDEIKYQELCIDLDSFFSSLPVAFLKTDKINTSNAKSNRNQSIIYRARENETVKPQKSSLKLPFKYVHKISHRPLKERDEITSFGRCNKPGEPRFYASTNPQTAASEAITTGFVENPKSRGVTVGCWKIVEPLNLALINYSVPSLKYFLQYDEDKYKNMIDYAVGLNKHHLNQIKDEGLYNVDFAKDIMSLLAYEFAKINIKSDHDYKISNYYCDHIFERTFMNDDMEQFDGILYPSVSLSYQEHNLVIHPRAMKKLKFLNAMMLWVSYHEQAKTCKFTPMEQNIPATLNGIIEWKEWSW